MESPPQGHARRFVSSLRCDIASGRGWGARIAEPWLTDLTGPGICGIKTARAAGAVSLGE